jgi:hypothetical protein
MAAFDRLPASARVALANAAFCWAVQPVLTHWRRRWPGYKNGKEIAAKIQEWDRAHHAKDVKRGRSIELRKGASFQLGRRAD